MNDLAGLITRPPKVTMSSHDPSYEGYAEKTSSSDDRFATLVQGYQQQELKTLAEPAINKVAVAEDTAAQVWAESQGWLVRPTRQEVPATSIASASLPIEAGRQPQAAAYPSEVERQPQAEVHSLQADNVKLSRPSGISVGEQVASILSAIAPQKNIELSKDVHEHNSSLYPTKNNVDQIATDEDDAAYAGKETIGATQEKIDQNNLAPHQQCEQAALGSANEKEYKLDPKNETYNQVLELESRNYLPMWRQDLRDAVLNSSEDVTENSAISSASHLADRAVLPKEEKEELDIQDKAPFERKVAEQHEVDTDMQAREQAAANFRAALWAAPYPDMSQISAPREDIQVNRVEPQMIPAHGQSSNLIRDGIEKGLRVSDSASETVKFAYDEQVSHRRPDKDEAQNNPDSLQRSSQQLSASTFSGLGLSAPDDRQRGDFVTAVQSKASQLHFPSESAAQNQTQDDTGAKQDARAVVLPNDANLPAEQGGTSNQQLWSSSMLGQLGERMATQQTAPQAAEQQASPQVISSTELGQAMATNVVQGVQQLRLRLSPEGLGELDVRVRVKGSQVSVQVIGDSPDLIALVNQNTASLRRDLSEHHLNLQNIDFEQHHANDSHQNPDFNQASADSGNFDQPKQPKHNHVGEENGLNDPAHSTSKGPRHSSTRVIDIIL